MKSLVISEFGVPPQMAEVDTPIPGAGEVLIDVAACGLNFADLLLIKGEYQETPPLPFSPGMELAGRVSALGAGVTAVAVGDRVAAFSGAGGLAEKAVMPANLLTRVPDGMPLNVAAGFQVAYGTSHVALAHRAKLQAGETLLVLGAAGGVGLTAVELGRAMGARVIAVARGQDKLAVAEAAGAHHLIDSETENLRDAVRALGGADVVYDPVGGGAFEFALRATNPEGRMIVIGFASGEVPRPATNLMLVKNITVSGFYWGGYLKFRPEVLTDSLAQLFKWYGEGKLKPHVSTRLPLDRANEGLTLLRERKTTGKVVIDCDQMVV